MSERTLILIKPDGVGRGLIGEVVNRVECRGYRLVAMNLVSISVETAQQHYREHQGEEFFTDLIEFITSGPVLVAVAEGPGVIRAWRLMMGSTDPIAAGPGTIRGDFGTEIRRNIVHGSDSPESAVREIALFFPDLPASPS